MIGDDKCPHCNGMTKPTAESNKCLTICNKYCQYFFSMIMTGNEKFVINKETFIGKDYKISIEHLIKQTTFSELVFINNTKVQTWKNISTSRKYKFKDITPENSAEIFKREKKLAILK